MSNKRVAVLATVLAVAPAPVLAQASPEASGSPAAESGAIVEIVASGLTHPRGLAWDADGVLHVALAGNGGDNEGVWQGAPSGNFAGPSSSIIKLVDGCPAVVAEGLSSSNWRAAGWVWGVMDIVFVDGQLYALLGGGGEDFGSPETPNGVYRVNEDGSTALLANLSSWLGDLPPSTVAPDYNSDGSLFDMEASEDALWVSDAISGRLIKVGLDGTITEVADISEGHLVPTGVALAPEGGAYVGHETAAPYVDGSSKVIHVAEDGTVTDAWTGLTVVTDVVLGPDGSLYAAEMSTGNTDAEPFLQRGSGRIVRQTGPDSLEVVAEGLDLPVGLGFGPDGALYFSSPAYGADNGEGSVSRLVMTDVVPAATSAPSCPPAPSAS